MEGLKQLVSESLARHGFETTLDRRRLQWSRWFRVEDSCSLVLVPSKAGLFALAEEVIAPGELPSTGGRRMLALFQVTASEDLGMALGRLFLPGSPERHRFETGRCFARYVVIEDQLQRQAARAALEQWINASSETASGIMGNLSLQSPAFVGNATQSADLGNQEHHAAIALPAEFPSGF